MDDDKINNPSDIQMSAAKVHGQLTGISNDIKQMASSIESLVKIMTLSAVVQSNQIQRSADSRMVQGMTDPLRVTEQSNESIIIDEAKNSGLLNDGNSDTYSIEDSTWAFLVLTFAVRKPADNKTRKAWEMKFRIPECDAVRYPKLDTIVEGDLKKDALDKDRELSRLQNFVLDTAGLLVSTFEELGKEEPDPDHVAATIQQALLFLGNANAHFSQVHLVKILKWLNPEVQSLAKDADFSQSAPYLLDRVLNAKSRSMWT